MDIKEDLKRISERKDIERFRMKEITREIIKGNISSAQIGGLLIGLKSKGETFFEILGIVEALREDMKKIDLNEEYLIDTCGTGGDSLNTFNISTITAIIACSGGVKVAKHGNRSITSKCGSKDVLEELGINSDLPLDKSKRMIKDYGMSFLFAKDYHEGMKNVSKERKELGVRTIFNLIGPLINPAEVKGQLLGIYDGGLLEVVAKVSKEVGLLNGLIVHGGDGLDEISLSSHTDICEIKDKKITKYSIKPEDFGFKRCKIEEVSGGTPKENAEIILDILKGKRGPKRDIVLLNAGAALYVGKSSESIFKGIKLAEKLLDSGAAYLKYLSLKEKSNSI